MQMWPSVRQSCVLHAPVTAVTVSPSWLCFAVGNRVLATAVDDAVDCDSVFVLTELPNGAVITALEQHERRSISPGECVTSTVVVGSADRVYIAPLHFSKLRGGASFSMGPRRSELVLSLNSFARVLCIHSLGTAAGVLVLTTLNSAYIIPEEHMIATQVSSTRSIGGGDCGRTVVKHTVEGLGVALAACALMTADRSAILVFAGTYAGGVAVWCLPVQSDKRRLDETHEDVEKLTVLSRIHAHNPSCAIFGVAAANITNNKNSTDGLSSALCICVATCSDDRTATVYVSRGDHCAVNGVHGADSSGLSRAMEWVCCWRGCGISFSRRRLFDVSILVTQESSGVVVATGGEDGSVNVVLFNQRELATAETPLVPQTLLYRTHQHEGNGVYKLAVVERHGGQAASCGREVAVVSCGFDGFVYYTRLMSPKIREVTLVPGRSSREKYNVRGMYCDDSGTLLACTEDELVVARVDETESSVFERRFPLPTSCSDKRNLPSCLHAVTLSCPVVSLGDCTTAHLALIGTTAGCVLGVLYDVESPCDVGIPNDGIPATVVKLATTSSKVLFAGGLQCEQRLVLVTVHASGQLVVWAFEKVTESPVEWLSTACAGTRTTALSLCLAVGVAKKAQLHIFTGNDGGGLCIRTMELCGSEATLVAVWKGNVFQSPVSLVDSRELLLPTGCVETQVTVLSCRCEWRVLIVGDGYSSHVDIKPASCPLLLPWRASTLLTWSSGTASNLNSRCNMAFAAALLGNDVTVYARSPHVASWHPITQLHGVQAPRLLAATVSVAAANDGFGGKQCCIYVGHCSAGTEGKWCGCSPRNSSRLLYGNVAAGRDYNAVLVLPEPTAFIICGAEQSSLSVMNHPSKGTKTLGVPQSLLGPHESNILGMAHCNVIDNLEAGDEEVRFVTVGGLATVAVWGWSVRHSWRVLAHTSLTKQRKGGGNTNTTVGQRVARFLTTCTTKDDIVVGGSDGLLRIFELNAQLRLRQELMLNAREPKPVTAACTLSTTKRLVLVGDTNGVLYICCAERGAVLRRNAWNKVTVNALSAEQVGGVDEIEKVVWRVFAAMDSGDVLLVRASLCGVEVLSFMRVGLTACRGVVWMSCGTSRSHDEHSRMAVAVNNEWLTFLQVRGSAIHVVGNRRVNVRGVSGLAVGNPASQPDMCVVVGQGVEVVPLRWEEHITT